MEIIHLTNNTGIKKEVKSFDGDSFDLLPYAQAIPVEKKSDWNLPRGVTQVDPASTSLDNRPLTPITAPPASFSDARALMSPRYRRDNGYPENYAETQSPTGSDAATQIENNVALDSVEGTPDTYNSDTGATDSNEPSPNQQFGSTTPLTPANNF